MWFLLAAIFFTPEMISSHLEPYTAEERVLIEKDLTVVRGVTEKEAGGEKFYLATAGSPGSRKTTILEHFVEEHPEYQSGVYLDPDPRTLRFMANTYQALSLSHKMIAKAPYDDVIKNAYDKWRYASNYIVLTLLEEALAAGKGIVYGTTSTGAHVGDFFGKLKENGYKVSLLLCSCPEEMREKAIRYRNETVRFYQNSVEDAINKALFFPERMQAYFTTADELYFYWSDDLETPERLGGVWKNGRLEIRDVEAMDRFVSKYEEDRARLSVQGKVIPPFYVLLCMR